MNQEILKQLELLKPGDLILQEGSDPLSQHVKRLSQGNYSHVRIYVGKNNKGEHSTIEILVSGIVEQELSKGFKDLSAVKFSAFRHVELSKFPSKIENLIEIARSYKDKSCYASINMIELTSKILVYDFFARKTPHAESLRKIYEKYFYLMLRVRKDNKKLFTCSGFVYQVFFDADFPIYNNRFDFLPNYRTGKDNDVDVFLSSIQAIARDSIDDEVFLKQLNQGGFLDDEISDEELMNILINEGLFEFLGSLESQWSSESKRGITQEITKHKRQTKKEYKKVIEAHTLLYMLLADGFYKKVYNRKLSNDNLEPPKRLIDLFKDYNLSETNYGDHVFFGVSDIATSSSLEMVLENIILR